MPQRVARVTLHDRRPSATIRRKDIPAHLENQTLASHCPQVCIATSTDVFSPGRAVIDRDNRPNKDPGRQIDNGNRQHAPFGQKNQCQYRQNDFHDYLPNAKRSFALHI